MLGCIERYSQTAEKGGIQSSKENKSLVVL